MLNFIDLQEKKYTIIIAVSSVVLILILVISGILVRNRSNPTETVSGTPINPTGVQTAQISPTEIPANYYVLPTPLSDENVPTAPPTPVPQEGDIILDGIAVNDFKENAERTTVDGDTVLAETSNYQIVFYEKTQEFTISLIGTDFEKSRIAAENAFLVNLEIDRANACRLFVNEYVPNTVNNEHSGEILPLSFCYHEHDE
ncbi:hypothetical protein IPM65_00900 [Candidatus Roizmanbacteria bacterium]|nr:MAG: hypothetical protein IPM65_00900 [Candidatus Roizmanbacteria bacterium]